MDDLAKACATAKFTTMLDDIRSINFLQGVGQVVDHVLPKQSTTIRMVVRQTRHELFNIHIHLECS